jgi:predicted kinase
MRKLIILSGPPGSGKSTFVKENNLKEYTLCPDEIRLMFDAPQMDEHGSSISQKDNKIVFETMYNILEYRMKKGAFTAIDATHTAERDFTQYKALCKKYRYKMIVVPFDTPLDVLLERNKHRGIKLIPEEIIIKMKDRFDNLKYTFGTVVKPEDYSEYIKYQPTILDDYKAVHHIGDIHGCYSVLENIFPLKDDEFYIFLGDYFDRGIENTKVAKWIFKNYKRKNVVFLRGNHECHLDDYLNGEEIKSSDFEKTIIEFENNKVRKKDLKDFTFSLIDVFLYTYHGKTVLCSHGGLSKYPENINLINPIQFIRGVGNYSTEIDKIFKAPKNVWQVHGHRNLLRLPIEAGKQSFNLTDEVETGGYLRTLTLTKAGFTSKKYKNEVFYCEDNTKQKNMFQLLSKNKNIKVDVFDNISSFVFTESTSEKQLTNGYNMAKGLFVNNNNYKVVCRGYNKLLNINKTNSFDMSKLSDLKYPLSGYIKETGYLGLLGVDEETENLVFTSKNAIGDESSKRFEKILREKLSDELLNKLRLEILNRNLSLIFEVIDEKQCKNIIKYDNEKDVILLDIITRDYDLNKKSYSYLVNFAHRYGLTYKRKVLSIHSYEKLCKTIESVQQYGYNYKGQKIEGFVIEDSDGFQFKLNTGYYYFWKQIKDVIESENEFSIDKILERFPGDLFYMAKDVIGIWKEKKISLIELKNLDINEKGA